MSTQSTIEGILSQKVVQNGSGYAIQNDIVNVDNISSTGLIKTTGSILSSGPVACDNITFRQGSSAGIYAMDGTIHLNSSHLDLNGGLLKDTSNSGFPTIKLGSNLDTQSNQIVSGSGTILMGSDASFLYHGIRDTYLTLSNQLDGSTWNPAITFEDKSIGSHDPIANITGRFNIKTENAGTIYISGSNYGDRSKDNITGNSIVIVTPAFDITGVQYWVTTGVNNIRINTSQAVTGTFNYFIVSY